jgi:hypothetical protein
MPQRREINFADTDAVASEVKRLRGGGYTRAGNWTLAQICYHLNIALRSTMRSGPHQPVQAVPDAPEKVKGILASGKIPDGIRAPDQAIPPPNTPMTAVDDLLKALVTLKTFPGPFAPHRLFGELPTPDFRRLHLIHCAHHLGYLVPTSEARDKGPATP